MSNILDTARRNVAELHALVGAVDPGSLSELRTAILAADRVYFTGVGRSGLVAKAVVMRLMHIGLPIAVVGEIASPAIGPADLLVACSATGRGSILQQARTAKALGAQVAVITTVADGELNSIASAVVVLPVRSAVATAQHAGSLFEQGVLVIGDALCAAVQEDLGVQTIELNSRHANLT